MKRSAVPFVMGIALGGLSYQAHADILWTYDSDIDKTPHYLRINRITETGPPDEEIRGFEIDGRFGLTDNIGLLLRHSFGSGDAFAEGEATDLTREIYDIGFSYGNSLNESLFYELKTVFNHSFATSKTDGERETESTYAYRLTPRIRYDINDYLQTRAQVEFERPHNADLGSEAALYLTVIPTEQLSLDIKFGKGITTTDHADRKWADDQWYVEPRLSYRIAENFTLEAAYRDKEGGGQIIDFGVVAFF